MGHDPFKIEEEKEKLRKYDGEYKVSHCYDIKKSLEEERKVRPAFVFKTKFDKLDKILGGEFRQGQLVIVSGQTRMGKTSFLQTLTFRFAEQNLKSLWFSYEMPYEDFFEKFDWTGIPLPEFFLPNKVESQNIKWLRERILEGVVKYGIKIVFIDNLHFLIPPGSVDTQREISDRIRTLKNLAVNLKLVIFLIVHTKKSLVEVGIPSLEDIRDSGMIAADSDYVLFIWRKREKQSKAELQNEGIKFHPDESVLYVAKNRRTGQCDFMSMKLENNIFKEVKDLDYDTINNEEWSDKNEHSNNKESDDSINKESSPEPEKEFPTPWADEEF